MNSRHFIEEQFKDIALPAGEAKVERIKIELLMDIRDYLGALVSMEQHRESLDAVRSAREVQASKRYEEVE